MTEEMIGDYRVIDKIGAGGMAKVYLGVHKNVPNLKVILKVLEDPLLSERFTQEADKLAVLDGHPAICRIKHFFSVGDRTAIVMEYIDGQSLEEAIQERGKLSPGEATTIICDVLDTLQFAHDKGISHRDIKPNNIMINKAGVVKIIDFGIAKAQDDPQLTMAGTACGTPQYMSPEQFNPPPGTDYALADIYAVGTTLYRMVCGELPYKGDNPFVLRDAKLTTDPANPRSLDKNIPKELEAIIIKAIARVPSDRYGSAAEMKQALSQTIQGEPISVSDATMAVHGRGQATPTPSPKSTKKPWGIIAGAAVLVLAAVGYLFWPSGEEQVSPRPVEPKPATLVSPTNGATLTDTRSPRLIWNGVKDFSGPYMVDYASDSGFTTMLRFPGVTDTGYVVSTELTNGPWYWRVSYRQGEQLLTSGVGSFNISFDSSIADSEQPPVVARTGWITIKSNLTADFYVDANLVASGQTEYSSEFNEGSHSIAAVSTGSVEGRQDKTTFVRSGRPAAVNFNFTAPTENASNQQPDPPDKPVTPVNTGPVQSKLLVASKPFGATIFVDGELQPDISTPYSLTVMSGKRVIKVVVTGEGGGTKTATIDVKPGENNRMMFDLEQDKVLFDF